MAVKTVTNANLAEYVAERQEKAAQAQTGTVATVDKTAPVTGVVGSGEETIASTPPPTDAKPTAQVKAEEEKSNKAETPKTVPYDRFKEVNDRNKELDEFAQGEYEGRLTAQKRIGELEAEIKKLAPPAPKVEEVKPPDPKAFTVQAEYDKAVEEYQNAIIDKRVEVKLAAKLEAERQQKALELMDARAQQTAQEIGDYWDVMRTRGEAVFEAAPPYIKAAIVEWETGPKLAYHFAKQQAEMKRVYAMTPIKAMEALAALRDKYAKPIAEPEAEAPPRAAAPVTTRAPAPVTAIRPTGETVLSDQPPSNYEAYKPWRLAQQRQRKLDGRRK